MSNVKWLKLSTTMFEDEKIRLIEQMPDADTLLVCWFKLFLSTSKDRTLKLTNFAKDTHTNEQLLSILLEKDIEFIERMVKVFTEIGVMEINYDVIQIKRFWLTNQEIRGTKEYKEWRISVFSRDEYTCQECNQIGGSLEAHHIKPFAKYEELRFELSNGLTLCVTCHKELHQRALE